jgi:hypothetical protein
MRNPIFNQNEKYSYRDPAAFIKDGVIYLFFTIVINENDNQYFCIAMSESNDLQNWTKPEILTEKDISKNYSSPGNVVEYNNEYYLCLQSYPRPDNETYGNENSRIFTMKSYDLRNWSKPELLMVKGDVCEQDMGRMIDPYILDDGDDYICFFKQNGVSFSKSKNLKHWHFQGYTECGENVCAIKNDDEYIIFNSPENGINILTTKDFINFDDKGTIYLNQDIKPWAKDRITAGFVIDIGSINDKYKYAMFYHGDEESNYLFGASLAVAFSNNLYNWVDE